jgi:ribose 5-phosphate isomerase B
MIIYIGSDHRGFYLKETLIEALNKKDGYQVVDIGNSESSPTDDYPDFASAVAEKVAGTGSEVRGIVICGSGFGVDIVANKFKGVRSALAMSAEQIRAGRHDDDVNVLSLAANFIKPEEALEIVNVFLATPFESNEERYVRRLDKITAIENK